MLDSIAVTRLPPGPAARYPGQFALAIIRRPLEFLPQLARDFGDAATFHVGAQPIVLVSHPDAIRDVYSMWRPVCPGSPTINPDDTFQPVFARYWIAAMRLANVPGASIAR